MQYICLPKANTELTLCLQVLSVYMTVDVRFYCLDLLFFFAFVWGCATFAVVFYGVDSVDRNRGVDLKYAENFQWIHVSLFHQTFCSKHHLFFKDYVPHPFEQGAGLKILYLWVPRMFTHVRDNAKLKFKSKTRSNIVNWLKFHCVS